MENLLEIIPETCSECGEPALAYCGYCQTARCGEHIAEHFSSDESTGYNEQDLVCAPRCGGLPNLCKATLEIPSCVRVLS